MNQREKRPEPWPLTLYHRCQQYNTLPRAGGILDQDDYVMQRMSHAANVYALAQMGPMELIKADPAGDGLRPYRLEVMEWVKNGTT